MRGRHAIRRGNKEEDGAGQDRMAQTMGPLAEEEGSSGPLRLG